MHERRSQLSRRYTHERSSKYGRKISSKTYYRAV